MPGPTFLRGEVVELRTVEDDDAALLAALLDDPRVRTDVAPAEPTGEDGRREWIRSVRDDAGARFVVCDDGEPVGYVGLQPPNDAWGTAEFGYAVAPDARGNGYATDATRALCEYAFGERRLAKLYGVVYASNDASQRVLSKVGFEREAVLRQEAFVDGERVDAYRYALLAEDWSGG